MFKFSKKYFSELCPILKSPWDSGDGDVEGDGEKFFIGKCYENEMT